MKTLQNLPFAFKLLGTATLYGALAQLSLNFFSLAGTIGTFWPASGLGLAVLLLGGNRLAWGIFAGALASELMLDLALPAAVTSAGGATLGALLGSWLLRRDAKFNRDLDRLGDFARLIVWAAIPASVLSALFGVGSMTATGDLSPDDLGRNVVQWVIGDALGILLVTPLILIWRQVPGELKHRPYWTEAALLLPCSRARSYFGAGYPRNSPILYPRATGCCPWHSGRPPGWDCMVPSSSCARSACKPCWASMRTQGSWPIRTPKPG